MAAVWITTKHIKLPARIRQFSQICNDAVFPSRCWQCDEMYVREGSGSTSVGSAREAFTSYGALMADYLCPYCAKLYARIQSPLCSKCGLPFKTRHGVDHRCPDCLKLPFGFDSARAAGVFDRTLKTMIHQFKYQGRTELVRPLGYLLWEALHRFYDVKAFDLIVPIPLHWFRRYRRGFNQAALLVRQWTKLADEPDILFGSAMVSEKVVFRQRHTLSQTGLGKKRRIANLQNAFVVRSPDAVKGKRILLVDDVLTTGATTDACARTLKGAGAESVKVLTVARAV